jgi:hypothetical protein
MVPAALAILAFLAICLLVGSRRERHRIADSQALARQAPLAYLAPMPGFGIALAHGGNLTDAGLRGKWTLLVMANTWCTPCQRELRCLDRASKVLRPHVRIVVVLAGRPLIGDPAAAARNYARQLGTACAIGVDPMGTVASSMGLGRYAPAYVLTDPCARVRLVGSGHSPTAGGSSYLSDVLLAHFSGARPDSVAITQVHRFTSTQLWIRDRLGKRTNLLAGSRTGIVVIMLLSGNDQEDTFILGQASRFRCARNARFMALTCNPRTKPRDLVSTANLDVHSLGTEEAFRQFGSSVVLAQRGRVFVTMPIEAAVNGLLEAELGSAVLLTSRTHDRRSGSTSTGSVPGGRR